MEDIFVFWPFPVVLPESQWSEFHHDFIDFMRVACAEGYRPRHHMEACIDAGDSSKRGVSLVRRGSRNGWEPFLFESGKLVRLGPSFGFDECCCICIRPPFQAAAHLALEWLRGRPLDSLLSDFAFVGGYPSGVELRPEALRPALVLG
jgi:hypothetical protein